MADINVKFYKTKDSATVYKEADITLTVDGKLPVASLMEKFDVKTLEEIRDGKAFIIGADEHFSLSSFTGKRTIKVTGDPKDIADEKAISLECGKATERQISAITGVAFSMDEWSFAPEAYRINLDPQFVQEFQNICDTWGKRNESDRRQYIDCILRHAVIAAGLKGKVRICTEVKMNQLSAKRDSSGRNLDLTGKADYTVTHATDDVDDDDETILSQLLIVGGEAKAAWSDKAMTQLSAYAAIMHSKRKTASKPNLKVWGFLSNGQMWKFLRVTEDGIVEASELVYIGNLRTVKLEELRVVMGGMVNVLTAAYNSSPTGTPVDSLENLSI